jgi:hypothetical protein
MRLFRALRDFVADLMAGDPVALALVLAILVFVSVIGLWGLKIMRDKRRMDEARKNRFKNSRDQKP